MKHTPTGEQNLVKGELQIHSKQFEFKIGGQLQPPKCSIKKILNIVFVALKGR